MIMFGIRAHGLEEKGPRFVMVGRGPAEVCFCGGESCCVPAEASGTVPGNSKKGI